MDFQDQCCTCFVVPVGALKWSRVSSLFLFSIHYYSFFIILVGEVNLNTSPKPLLHLFLAAVGVIK